MNITAKTSNLKVLILSIPFTIPAGSALMPQRLFSGLVNAGIDAAVITHWWDCGFEPLVRYSVITADEYKSFYRTKDMNGNRIAKVDGWRVVYTPNGKQKIPSKITPLVSRYQIIRTGKHIIREAFDYLSAKGFVPDIIHTHTHTFSYDGTLGEIVRLSGNPPVVFTLHALIRKISRSREVSQKDTLNISDAVVTISDGWRDEIEKTYNVRCSSIHNCTDYFQYTDDRSVTERSVELYSRVNPEGGKIVLYSGRLEYIKVQGLAKAFSDVADDLNAKLVIMGSPGGDSELKKLIGWGLDRRHIGRVVFTGWINGMTESGRREIAAYYKMLSLPENEPCGVLAMPVRTRDHYGLSVLDAVAMKAPVITCRGRLATYGCLPDAASLRNAIMHIFSNPLDVKKKVDSSYKIAKREFSVDGYYVPMHLSLYNRLVGEGRSKTIELVKSRESRIRKRIMAVVRERENKRIERVMQQVAEREIWKDDL